MAEENWPADPERRFGELVRDFGADLQRWPQGEQEWARGFADSSQAGVRHLAAERALDTLIASAVPERAPPELFAAVLAARERNPWQRWLAALWPGMSPAAAASICASALLLGLLFGAALPFGVAPEADDAVAAAFAEMIFDLDSEELT